LNLQLASMPGLLRLQSNDFSGETSSVPEKQPHI